MHISGAAKASLSKIAHSLNGARVWNCVKFQYITRGLAGVAVRQLPTNSLSGSADAPLVSESALRRYFWNWGADFNRSAQHLLILRGEEVCHGDVADLVHGSAESRAVGAMEERAKCCGHLAGAGKEEQDRR